MAVLQGYWLVASDGGIFSFGDAQFYGSEGGLSPTAPIVGMAATVTAKGYWLVGNDGNVYPFGDAVSYGTLPALNVKVNNIVGIAATPTGKGYWLVGSDGGVFAFGDAPFEGSEGGKHLNKPVVAMAAVPVIQLSAPVVTKITPTSGADTGGTTVIIEGENFSNATKVMFGAVPATSFELVSDTEIKAVSPPEAMPAIASVE
jgi:hypothetical protein